MSWIERLYQTYENNQSEIGKDDDKVPLLPIFHTIQNAQITITLNGDGKFLRAAVVAKKQAATIIPATEKSAGRTSGEAAHPLCDKLQYVAADYPQYGGGKNSYFQSYLKQLEQWCTAPERHPKAVAVCHYISEGKVIADLIAAGILPVDGQGKLLKRWEGKEAPAIFEATKPGDPSDAFIRWEIETPGCIESSVWRDQSLWMAWIKYHSNLEAVKGLCMVLGQEQILASQHPARIRNGADKAKLISANDNSGFTFRGRFTTPAEACGVSVEVTQKAHNALRWLINRQGWQRGDQAIVAWAVSGEKIPDPLANSAELFGDAEEPMPTVSYTAQNFGNALAKLIAGYAAKLNTVQLVVMGVDSATPGRMSISFYRELTGAAFLQRIENWHRNCCWTQSFSKDIRFIGAPSPEDIAEAAYGRRLDDKLKKATVNKILPCIIDGGAIANDIVDNCIRHASNRNGNDYWEKTLGIACALFKYQNQKRNYTMALDRQRKEKDYLYGRLLAIADCLEGLALKDTEPRPTNAARLMQQFANRPFSTWKIIELALAPYKMRLLQRAQKYDNEFAEVFDLFTPEKFDDDKPLSGEFLLGYHSQRNVLFSKNNDGVQDETNDIQSNNNSSK